jgi:hypothetical protein
MGLNNVTPTSSRHNGLVGNDSEDSEEEEDEEEEEEGEEDEQNDEPQMLTPEMASNVFRTYTGRSPAQGLMPKHTFLESLSERSAESGEESERSSVRRMT